MLKKIVEYDSSISQEITVSFVKALKAFETTHLAIANITDAPATIAPEAQEEQAGEHTKAEVADIEESKNITQEGTEGNGQD